jgi:2-phospho-L-lactate guanylyltransferase
MSLFTVIPVKPFSEGKSRLKGILSDRQRIDLNRQMFEHVLEVAAAVLGPATTIVVSADQMALDIARNTGAIALREESRAGLNAALAIGAAAAHNRGAGSLLILPTDLPHLEPSDVEALIDPAGRGSCVVIAPDLSKHGTNALLTSPPGVIDFSFGESSFAKHRNAARAVHLEPVVVQRGGLAFDIDTPEDFRQLETSQLQGGGNDEYVGE